jgi:hypothetical protein
MIRSKRRSVLVLALSCGLTSCGYDYDSEEITLQEGQILSTHHNGRYRLDRVESESITLSDADRSIGQGWKLSTMGRWGGGEPHALGNNESLKILNVDPDSKIAELELRWLDWVGPLTMPPF